MRLIITEKITKKDKEILNLSNWNFYKLVIDNFDNFKSKRHLMCSGKLSKIDWFILFIDNFKFEKNLYWSYIKACNCSMEKEIIAVIKNIRHQRASETFLNKE